tara:strand:+ start:207 stop:392 length:186 start_codon:yes stop_codon:yes gene_type:complete
LLTDLPKSYLNSIKFGEEHSFNEYHVIKRAIDKNPEDPIAKKSTEIKKISQKQMYPLLDFL